MRTFPYPATEVRAADSRGRTLVVRFEKRGDRYGHTIILEAERGPQRLFESLEGDAKELWPPSPPLEDLNNCTIESDVNSGQVTMLGGAAGNSHWAMAVSPRYVRYGQGAKKYHAELLFDVACRVRETPQWLGSSYKIVGGQSAFSKILNLVRVPVERPACLVMPENSSLVFEMCTGSFPIVRCQAAISQSELPVETVRWQYAIRIAE